MTTISGIKCDACGCEMFNPSSYHWEQRPSVFKAQCPPDGVNCGIWEMDVCRACRTVIHDAIKEVIAALREHRHESQQLPLELQSAIEEREERG